ncbi:MAG: shikimate dehydrogenase, partial [Flavobacteriales bacterium]|nr:shikimate dehydrogenase [Flavobacteriales bacterium]
MKKYGLIGRNISYSFSGRYFTEKWEREGVEDCSYTIYDIEKVEDIKKILEDKEIKGLNVTIPYKVEVMSLLDDISAEAREIGAVNTIKVLPDGRLVGYNSDVYGFRSSLAPYLESHHNRALILGTGGASRAVAYALKSLGIDY